MKLLQIRTIITFCISSLIYMGITSAQSYLLGMIEVHFCNHEQLNKEIDMIAKAGEETPLCVEFKNKGSLPITLNVEFLDSTVTADSKQSRACNGSDRPKKYFGNFLIPYSGEITLEPGQTLQKKYIITYPIGFSGLSHGCLAYSIAGSDIKDSDMFTVRIRAIRYIDFFVTDTKATQAIKLSQSPILTKTDNEYIISFGIKNGGNVPEKVTITSILSNIFGYQREFSFEAILPAHEENIFTTESFILPVYGGPYRFTNKISYTPQFNFDIIDGTHPSEIYAGGTKKTQTLLFVWTRQSRLAIGIILLILFSLLRRKLPKR